MCLFIIIHFRVQGRNLETGNSNIEHWDTITEKVINITVNCQNNKNFCVLFKLTNSTSRLIIFFCFNHLNLWQVIAQVIPVKMKECGLKKVFLVVSVNVKVVILGMFVVCIMTFVHLIHVVMELHAIVMDYHINVLVHLVKLV